MLVAFQAVFQRTDDLQVQVTLLASFHEAAQTAARQHAGDHQHVGGTRAGGNLAHVFQLAQDGHLTEAGAAGDIFGGQQAAHPVGQMIIGLNLMRENSVGEIRPDQQCPTGVFGVEHRPADLAKHAPACPHHAQDGDHHDAVQNDHRSRDGIQGPIKEVRRGQD